MNPPLNSALNSALITPLRREDRLWTRRSAALAPAALALLALRPAQALEAGAAVPELTLPTRDPVRAQVSLAELKGQVVYLDFWASWCGPCKQSFPFMNELMARHGAKGLQVVAVNLDAKREDAERFLSQVPSTFTVAFDAKGDSARRFEVRSMPSSVVIGRDGRVLLNHKGFREEDRAAIEQGLLAALAAR